MKIEQENLLKALLQSSLRIEANQSALLQVMILFLAKDGFPLEMQAAVTAYAQAHSAEFQRLKENLFQSFGHIDIDDILGDKEV